MPTWSMEYYRERGYVKAQVGQPQLKILEDAKDGRTRFVELQIPVTEGARYRIGEVTFAGNTVVKAEGLRPLFKLEKGDWFNEKNIRKGFEKAREVYGSIGYFEFTGMPDYAFPNDPQRRRTDGQRHRSAEAALRRGPGRPVVNGKNDRAASSTSRFGSKKASSTSSTASSSSATRRRATTSSAARSGCSRTACSTPRR